MDWRSNQNLFEINYLPLGDATSRVRKKVCKASNFLILKSLLTTASLLVPMTSIASLVLLSKLIDCGIQCAVVFTLFGGMSLIGLKIKPANL